MSTASPFDRLATTNPFAAIYDRYGALPASWRQPLVTHAVGQTIPFVATAGCVIDTYTPSRVVVGLDDRRDVHNHVGGMHAAAMSLLAETASGLVVALNLTPPAVPLLRTMRVNYRQMASGRVTATATLSDEETTRLRDRPIGKIDVDVRLTDDAGRDPVDGTLQWAWVPASKLNR